MTTADRIESLHMDERDPLGDESGGEAMSDIEVRLRLSVALTGQGYGLGELSAQVDKLLGMRDEQRTWIANMTDAGINL